MPRRTPIWPDAWPGWERPVLTSSSTSCWKRRRICLPLKARCRAPPACWARRSTSRRRDRVSPLPSFILSSTRLSKKREPRSARKRLLRKKRPAPGCPGKMPSPSPSRKKTLSSEFCNHWLCHADLTFLLTLLSRLNRTLPPTTNTAGENATSATKPARSRKEECRKMRRGMMGALFLAFAVMAMQPAHACEECKLKGKIHIGQTQVIGNGVAYAWVRVKDGKPTTVGITLTESALSGLPEEPPAGMVGMEYDLALPKEAAGT